MSAKIEEKAYEKMDQEEKEKAAYGLWRGGLVRGGASQSVSQLFHGPAPRSPLHRLAVRLRHSQSNTSTEYSLPGLLNCRK